MCKLDKYMIFFARLGGLLGFVIGMLYVIYGFANPSYSAMSGIAGLGMAGPSLALYLIGAIAENAGGVSTVPTMRKQEAK